MRLLRRRMPRLQMGLIVAAAGLAGFLFSYALLNAGVTSMGLRYPLAATVAYGVFLAQLRLWLTLVRRRTELDLDVDLLNVLDGMDVGSSGRDTPRSPHVHDYDPNASPPVDVEYVTAPESPHLDVADADLDEGALVAIPLALAAAGLLAAVSVVYSAPVLFAELILDAIIVEGLYRRLRHPAPEGWLPVAFRHTRRAFAVLTVVLAVIGFGADALVPTADSIGDLLRSGARE